MLLLVQLCLESWHLNEMGIDKIERNKYECFVVAVFVHAIVLYSPVISVTVLLFMVPFVHLTTLLCPFKWFSFVHVTVFIHSPIFFAHVTTFFCSHRYVWPCYYNFVQPVHVTFHIAVLFLLWNCTFSQITSLLFIIQFFFHLTAHHSELLVDWIHLRAANVCVNSGLHATDMVWNLEPTHDYAISMMARKRGYWDWLHGVDYYLLIIVCFWCHLLWLCLAAGAYHILLNKCSLCGDRYPGGVR